MTHIHYPVAVYVPPVLDYDYPTINGILGMLDSQAGRSNIFQRILCCPKGTPDSLQNRAKRLLSSEELLKLYEQVCKEAGKEAEKNTLQRYLTKQDGTIFVMGLIGIGLGLAIAKKSEQPLVGYLIVTVAAVVCIIALGHRASTLEYGKKSINELGDVAIGAQGKNLPPRTLKEWYALHKTGATTSSMSNFSTEPSTVIILCPENSVSIR